MDNKRKGESERSAGRSGSHRVYYREYESPVGRLRLVERDGFLTAVSLAGKSQPDAYRRRGELSYEEAGYLLAEAGAQDTETELLARVHRELTEYFAGQRREFTAPLKPEGTPFQMQVWQALRTIPYGETRSYGQIAAQIGKPGASRAVGMGNHYNPIAILIPCHRVIGADGSLTGYGGGLDIKEYLLKLEGILC
ncbi:MAG: methylated-DNA--[protein]-cysteine S-methyltransferase [Lachnospiraceae bacterium]|jgi:methylated-DNA-[protein]-cysteine S-methyltransferase|nr:methylated-DNA--[protein]-cysteine S-methyltransferase [Lachnospiraceae bacterium]